MKQGWKKIITLMLALALAISVAPVWLNMAGEAQAESVGTTLTAAYGYVTADGVKVRRQASTSSVYWFKVDTGFVVEILGTETSGGITWYKVNSEHPTRNGRTYIGYIHGDFFKVMTAEEVEQWKQNNTVNGGTTTGGTTGGSSGSTSVSPAVVNGYVQLILSSANLRNEPAGDVVMQWENKGEILPYYGTPIVKGKYTWYNVDYLGMKYYVRNDTVQTVTAEGLPVTAAPASTPAPDSVTGYVVTTKGGVNLRLKPSGETITQVAKNVVVPCVGSMVTSGGYDWYYVNYNGMHGYLRGDCVKVCNADGSTSGAVTPPSSGGNTSTDNVVVYGYVKMSVSGVNLRATPAGSSQEQLAKDVIVPVIGAVVNSGKYTWYPVKAASGRTGYVRNDCIVICNADGTTEGAVLENAPAATTPPSSGSSSSTSTYGYIQLTKGGVNLRETVGGKSLTQLDKGTVWPMIASVQTVNNVVWYPVRANGYTGYVRGDCAFKLSATQEQSYLAGNGVPSEPQTSVPATTSYLKTTVAAVNLRASASKDSSALFNVPIGTVMAYNDSTTSGGSTWYRVVYQNKEVWVLGSCVAIMTAQEYQDYIAANPNNTPQPEVALGYLKTTLSDVNIRATAGGSSVLTRVDKGVVMPILATPTTARNYTWYLVKAPDGQRGYIRSDCIVICNGDGSEITGGSTGGSTTGQEATYTTLRLGSTGEEVERLVTELRNQGYYFGEIVSVYNSDVQAAVTAYQKDKGLSADGIAGPVTQHSLFGTVPAGSGTGDLTITLYPAEKIDWFTGGIQQLMPKGANFKVYDVKTGIVWWAHRWSGFNHADIETLTAADTARLCKIYGVSSASQITNDAGHWRRRPCLVTIGERTFACSLYGVPHNPSGDTISDNNMTGQICLHFTNSRTSDTDVVDEDHQEAIDYAWKNAPNGHK